MADAEWIDAPAILWAHGLAAATVGALSLVQWRRVKGDAAHRALGVAWVALMSVVIATSFFIRGEGDGFSWIHLLSVVTAASMAIALLALRRGARRAHGAWMSGAGGGLLIAGALTLLPSRIIGGWLFGTA